MAGRRPRTERDIRRRTHGQNFLRSSSLAVELVDDAGINSGDLVVEVGAGSGVLTRALAHRAGHLLAIEVDQTWAGRLRAQFSGNARVEIVHGDALAVGLPRQPYRVFGSIPFASTTSILRKLLDDPSTRMLRADVIVQWEVALKRILLPPRNVLTVAWAPWWLLTITRRISANCFRPKPSVDAAMLAIHRRDPPLLPAAERRDFEALVRGAFGRAHAPVRESVHVAPSKRARRVFAELGIDAHSRPVDLTVRQWVGIHRALRYRP